MLEQILTYPSVYDLPFRQGKKILFERWGISTNINSGWKIQSGIWKVTSEGIEQSSTDIVDAHISIKIPHFSNLFAHYTLRHIVRFTGSGIQFVASNENTNIGNNYLFWIDTTLHTSFYTMLIYKFENSVLTELGRLTTTMPYTVATIEPCITINEGHLSIYFKSKENEKLSVSTTKFYMGNFIILRVNRSIVIYKKIIIQEA